VIACIPLPLVDFVNSRRVDIRVSP
jgi:hypothetical protein